MESMLRILHLEDDPLDTTLVLKLLHADGLPAEIDRVDTFAEFTSALERGGYALILCDYNIPGTDIFEACQLARQMYPEVPFIVLSGTLGEDQAIDTLKMGATDYVLKQRIQRLVPAVRRAIQEAEEMSRRKAAEETLRESENRYRALITASSEVLYRMSPDWSEMRELHSREFLADTERPRRTWLQDYIPLDDQPRVAAAIEEAIRAKGVFELEHRVWRADGHPGWTHSRAVPLLDANGEIVEWFGAASDITERKRMEAELQSAKAAAEQANRAKDHFLAVLSHELRTPLTPVVMGVSMLQDRSDLDPATRETLEMVRRNVEMEARLIDDLLEVSGIARGKIELNRSPVLLCTILHRAVEVCRPDIEARRLHFGVDIGPSAPYWLHADASRLQQVFWNLLKNAIKFTPHGGCVGIRCRPNNGHVLVEVNDSGIGIDPEALSRVFNAFEQAERSITRRFGGLGLGLAITKALVELHGGQITAHSEGRDKGATFRVRLPLTVPAGQPERPAPPAVPGHRVIGPLRVLLVEDHGVTAKMMKMVLTAEGHTVETAGDVTAALELADRHTFDLLLSDLGLPDGSGHDLIRQLRDRGHRFPGIALSGYGQEEDIQRSREAGFAAHLTKPASREAVVEVVSAVTAAEPP